MAFDPNVKIMAYLTPEAHMALDEMYIKHIKGGKKRTQSAIICQAIVELYNKELAKSAAKPGECTKDMLDKYAPLLDKLSKT